jgi:uroporphyrinogen decarboxylase
LTKPQAKPLIRALHGERTMPPPVWLMRQAGRYLPEYRELRASAGSFLELCYDPPRAAEITLQPVRRFGMDAAILFSDILVVPHAMGQAVAFQEGEGPVLEPMASDDDIAGLDPDAVIERLAPVYETVSRVRGELPAETALIGFSGAPWTVATYMVEGGTSRDFKSVKRMAYGAPRRFAALIDKLIAATTTHLEAQVKAGAEALQLFDTWAGILPPDEFDRWVVEPTARIVAALRKSCPKVPLIGFPRGVGVTYADYAAKTGVDCVSLDTTVSPDHAAEVLQPKVAVQGNLDPVLLLVGGDPMVSAARKILRRLRGGGHVFNLGHGVLPETPPEHVELLVRTVREA